MERRLTCFTSLSGTSSSSLSTLFLFEARPFGVANLKEEGIAISLGGWTTLSLFAEELSTVIYPESSLVAYRRIFLASA
ncbi:hypothetical protein BDV98DRAFT_556875 [Pterulicium gracile]|uniref:Uncharacterized protein n=1 Tax=Pterulicium gracile TaxID=1884261 RepID=A0A5C3R1C8_9AGAR|nr:hypothetical protein BDV98DRAFT_556875 [Pterula gracilis]